MGGAVTLVREELKRQIARLQAALAAWPAGDGDGTVRQKLLEELEHRRGLLALLEPAPRA